MTQALSERGKVSDAMTDRKKIDDPVYAKSPGLEPRANGHLTLLGRIQLDPRFKDVPADHIFYLGPYLIDPETTFSFLGNKEEGRESRAQQQQMQRDKQRAIRNGVQIGTGNVIYEVIANSWLQTQFLTGCMGYADYSGRILVGILGKPKT